MSCTCRWFSGTLMAVCSCLCAGMIMLEASVVVYLLQGHAASGHKVSLREQSRACCLIQST
jgi:hypothetical protein